MPDKWKYKEADVTVGENMQRVRQLTADERRQFAEASKKNKEAGAAAAGGAMAQMQTLVEWAAIPTLAKEDVAAMPPELLDACTAKIMELSGLSDKDDQKKV